MSAVAIYDVARVAFGGAQIDWRSHPMAAAIPHAGYIPNLTADASVGVVYPLPVPVVQLAGQKIEATGFLQCNAIFFPATPPGVVINNVVIYRLSDQMLVLNVSFPAFSSSLGKAMVLLQGYSHPGLCRL